METLLAPTQIACPRCSKPTENRPHTCPYQQEINDDSATLCLCCDSCMQECIDDI